MVRIIVAAFMSAARSDGFAGTSSTVISDLLRAFHAQAMMDFDSYVRIHLIGHTVGAVSLPRGWDFAVFSGDHYITLEIFPFYPYA